MHAHECSAGPAAGQQCDALSSLLLRFHAVTNTPISMVFLEENKPWQAIERRHRRIHLSTCPTTQPADCSPITVPFFMSSVSHDITCPPEVCVCVCVRACPLESGQSCHLNQGLFLNLGMRLSMRWTEDDTQQSSIAPPPPATRKFSDAECHLH